MRIKSLIIITMLGASYKLTAQNVGIGTSTATRAKLELNGMIGNTTAIFGTAGNGVGLVASAPNIVFNGYFNSGFRYINNGYLMNTYLDASTGSMGINVYANGVKDALATGVRSAISINPNGRVGIGDNPGYNAQLNVGKDVDKDASAWFSAPQFSAFNYTAAEHTYIRPGISSSPLFLNDARLNSKIVFGNGSSNVGINWSVPVYPLEIHQSSFGIGLARVGSDNNWNLSVYNPDLKLFFRTTIDNSFGTELGVFNHTTGQYSSSSDKRIKKEIKTLPPTLSKLLLLPVYRYEMKYNNPNHDETFGLIAQDVKKLFPTLVHVTQNANTGYPGIGDVHTVAYSNFAPIVIKALQEQQAQLQQLEEKLKSLEAK